MGKAGREKFLREFTLERFEKRIKEVLERGIDPRYNIQERNPMKSMML